MALLLLAAAAGLVPVARGYLTGNVGNQAAMVVTGASPLVKCTQPYTLELSPGGSLTGDYFSCTDNYNAPVTLNWSIVSVSPSTSALHVSGAGSLAAGQSGACAPVTLTADLLALPGTYAVSYRGTTAETAAFYASVAFTGQVKVGLLPHNPGSCGG